MNDYSLKVRIPKALDDEINKIISDINDDDNYSKIRKSDFIRIAIKREVKRYQQLKEQK